MKMLSLVDFINNDAIKAEEIDLVKNLVVGIGNTHELYDRIHHIDYVYFEFLFTLAKNECD